MKKIILILTLIFNVQLFSQERVSDVTPKISSTVNSSLNKATGWLFNPEGQWVSRDNRIPAFLSNDVKSLIDIGENGLGIDNFISYEFRDIIIKDSTYCILIKKHKDGNYKYSSLKEGWYEYTTVVFYVFRKNELDKLNQIKNDSINLISIDVLYSNNMQFINTATYLTDISKEILRQSKETKTENSNNKLFFHIAPYKSKKLVQFNIYSSYSSYKIIGGIIQELKCNESIQDGYKRLKLGDTSTKTYYMTNELFNHCYFETDYLTFSKFINF